MSSPAWERHYARKLAVSDTLIVVCSVAAAHWLRFGASAIELRIPFAERGDFMLAYTSLSALIALVWAMMLAVGGTRDKKLFGTGVEEYRRIVNATFLVFGAFAVVAFLMKAEIGRGYLLYALPIGLSLLLLSRWLWRGRLHRQRARGKNSYRTLIVGEIAKCEHVAREIMRSHENGLRIAGVVTDRPDQLDLVRDIEIVAGYENLLKAADDLDVDTVIMTSADVLSPEHIRDLGWQLEDRRIDLIVTAALTDVAGPRIHTRPVAGLPLIHVDYPSFSGPKQLAKRLFDITGSLLLILLFSPVMIVVAVAVKLGSKGPVFYSQERIGLNGEPFPMFKFRSMVQGADDQLQSLLDQQGTSGKPLHKVENDPRITSVGRFIRKYSLDELPQLFNVLVGTMSLVGPRPQRAAEVALYRSSHHRRLLVKPGITGLWQVSGRSNLGWEDAIRLDLYYVENWSFAGDLVLLGRTLRAVVASEGAH